jgi:hypothetical protein
VQAANHNNQLVFEKAQAFLGADVLLSSTVSSAQRTSAGVELVVSMPSGSQVIKASKLLVTAPPTIQNMAPLGLNTRESRIFQQFNTAGWYVALVNNTGLPSNTTFQNTGANTTFNLPTIPALYSLTTTGVDDILWAKFGLIETLSMSQVECSILAEIVRLRNGLGITSNQTPQILTYRSHAPFQLSLPADAISNGLYSQLNALQGYRSIYYSGQTFVAPHFVAVLNYTQSILPSIVAGL